MENNQQNLKRCVALCYQSAEDKKGKFDSHATEYITRLRDSVNKYTTINPDIILLTNEDLQIDGVIIKKFPDSFRGWHCRNCLFFPDMFAGYDRVLYIDLDSILVNNIDDILNDESDILLMYDLASKHRPWQYGIFSFNPNLFFIQSGEMYEFCSKQLDDPKKSSAAVFNNFLKQKDGEFTLSFIQDKYRICSYKLDIINRKRDANNYQVVCYHGSPYCHQTNWSVNRPHNRHEINKQKILQRKQQLKSNGIITRPTPKPRPLSNTTYSDVPRCWEGEDVFIIGGGSSLKKVNLDKFLFDKNVIGVNDAYEFKCCKMLFFGDTTWYRAHGDKVEHLNYPVYSIQSYRGNVKKLCSSTSTLEYSQPNKIIWSGNSGDATICLAILTGAKRIFLLGFDRCHVTGESNWHKNIRKVSGSSYSTMNKRAAKLNEVIKDKFPEVEIINVEIKEHSSQLTLYPKIYFNDIFEVNYSDIYMTDEEWSVTKDLLNKK